MNSTHKCGKHCLDCTAGNFLAQNTILLTPLIVVNASISNEWNSSIPMLNERSDEAEIKTPKREFVQNLRFRPISRSQSLREKKERKEKLDKTMSVGTSDTNTMKYFSKIGKIRLKSGSKSCTKPGSKSGSKPGSKPGSKHSSKDNSMENLLMNVIPMMSAAAGGGHPGFKEKIKNKIIRYDNECMKSNKNDLANILGCDFGEKKQSISRAISTPNLMNEISNAKLGNHEVADSFLLYDN